MVGTVHAFDLDDGGGTLVTDFETGRSRIRLLRLEVEDGPDRGKTLALTAAAPRVIGSDSEADLVLSDTKVSRRHVEVQVNDGRVRVRDLGSRNGTFHGDARIESAELGAGARFLVGKTVLRIAGADEDVELGDARTFDDLETDSAPLRRTFALLARAAKSDVTVLITGETGVGKDVLARAVHRQSARRDKPFVVLDCGSLTPTLAASALFGHKKGAFTGALQDARGVFEEADGGTLFIDEIGELPLELQPMLLRVLESRQVVRVGDAKGRPVDVRILAATNRDLRAEADAGRFRADLFFRLAVIRVHVPPLRERLDDLPLIVRRLLQELGRTERAFPPDDMAALKAYNWPGNVRELKNVVAQSVVLSEGPVRLFGLQPTQQPPAVAGGGVSAGVSGVRAGASAGVSGGESAGASGGEGASAGDVDANAPYREARASALDRFEASYIRALLEAHGGNVSKAARAAGIDRHYVHRLMKRHGLERE